MAIPALVWEFEIVDRIPVSASPTVKLPGRPITDIATKRMLKGTIWDLWVGDQLYVVATMATEIGRS
jgi:hypothetical protein